MILRDSISLIKADTDDMYFSPSLQPRFFQEDSILSLCLAIRYVI